VSAGPALPAGSAPGPRREKHTPGSALLAFGRFARAELRRRVAAAWARRRLRAALVGLGIVLLASLGTGWDFAAATPQASTSPAPKAAVSREAAKLAGERERLQAALARRVPRGPWIVIDQTHNRLRLMRGDETLLEAPCSAGSGMVLKEGARGRVWVFDTPRGRFEVLSKSENPVWKKPDWAFVEEGEPIPKDPADRLEYGSLGEYALYFGNGYMIHGTLYERLLGRPVSHGCIRLGKDPLRQVYRQAPLGTPVYIY
jgi:L,D-transpeptidase-like protein